MNGAEDCRAYVEHLYHEHHQLDQLVLEIGHEVAELGHAIRTADARAHLAQRLGDLHKQLRTHFAEEEAGGCLEEAVTRCPSLCDECHAILAEHVVLNRTLEDLVKRSRDPELAPADLQRNYQAFVERLRAHDAAETRMLQMAFGAEAADYDVEEVD
jgi:hypothetical protein